MGYCAVSHELYLNSYKGFDWTKFLMYAKVFLGPAVTYVFVPQVF